MDSLSPNSFCSALATAERSTFSMTRAACRGRCFSMANAMGTCWPRIMSITGLALRGATRTNLSTARASAIFFSVHVLLQCDRLFSLGLSMSLEESRRRKFAQFMTHHILGHEHGNKLLPVMDGERVSDHVRNDRRPSGPSLDDLPIFSLIHLLHLLEQMIVAKGALTNRSRHCALLTCGGR